MHVKLQRKEVDTTYKHVVSKQFSMLLKALSTPINFRPGIYQFSKNVVQCFCVKVYIYTLTN